MMRGVKCALFDSAIRVNTDKLPATLTVFAEDEGLKHAMVAGDRQALFGVQIPSLKT